jgi:hypothetical protein
VRHYTQKVIDAFGSGQIHTILMGIRSITEITKTGSHDWEFKLREDPIPHRTMSKMHGNIRKD